MPISWSSFRKSQRRVKGTSEISLMSVSQHSGRVSEGYFPAKFIITPLLTALLP